MSRCAPDAQQDTECNVLPAVKPQNHPERWEAQEGNGWKTSVVVAGLPGMPQSGTATGTISPCLPQGHSAHVSFVPRD